MSERTQSSGQSDQAVSSGDPDEIRAQIEATRVNLSQDVNALTDRAKPGNVARRQVGRVRGAAGGLKDKVMGGMPSAGGSSGSASSLSSVRDSVRDSVQGSASGLSDMASSAPSQVRAQAQGNPLAVGLVAFGVGWLVSSLLPASQVEQQAAQKVKDNAAPVTDAISGAAKDAAQNLKQPAQEAVQSLTQTATDAAETVRGEGQSAATDVRDQAQEAKDTVQESRS